MEVVNRCLVSYLSCFTSTHPKQWHKFLALIDFCYYSSYHTSLQTTTLKLVYERDPPSFLWYEESSTSTTELEDMLKT